MTVKKYQVTFGRWIFVESIGEVEGKDLKEAKSNFDKGDWTASDDYYQYEKEKQKPYGPKFEEVKEED